MGAMKAPSSRAARARDRDIPQRVIEAAPSSKACHASGMLSANLMAARPQNTSARRAHPGETLRGAPVFIQEFYRFPL